MTDESERPTILLHPSCAFVECQGGILMTFGGDEGTYGVVMSRARAMRLAASICVAFEGSADELIAAITEVREKYTTPIAPDTRPS